MPRYLQQVTFWLSDQLEAGMLLLHSLEIRTMKFLSDVDASLEKLTNFWKMYKRHMVIVDMRLFTEHL